MMMVVMAKKAMGMFVIMCVIMLVVRIMFCFMLVIAVSAMLMGFVVWS